MAIFFSLYQKCAHLCTTGRLRVMRYKYSVTVKAEDYGTVSFDRIDMSIFHRVYIHISIYGHIHISVTALLYHYSHLKDMRRPYIDE